MDGKGGHHTPHDASRLERTERALAEVEALAHVGSWAWDMEEGVVTWSAELRRIYGIDDQTPASFEAYLALVHPDDRERVVARIDRALADGRPVAIDHRIVRPDGAERTIHARGDVIRADGVPVRMVGTGQDVTAIREREAALAAGERRFRTVIDSAPDALVGADRDGRIVLVNERTEVLFGYTRDELLTLRIEDLLPRHLRARHVEHRAAYARDPSTRAMGSGLDLTACRKDGTEFPVDVSLATIETDEGVVVTAFVRDITERRRTEEAARKLHDVALRRQQALEINDSVVQGISAAVLALENGDALTAVRSLRATLEAARQMMGSLLLERTSEAPITPGDLLRARPAAVLPPDSIAPRGVDGDEVLGADPVRVLIVDDTDDMRLLLRHVLHPRKGFSVIAESSNGAEAVLAAKDLQPDLVLLDLAMPVMDGLQALPKIRAVAPEAKVVILSGYRSEQVASGLDGPQPDGYLEKGTPAPDIVAALSKLFPERAQVPPAGAPRTLEEQLAAGADVEMQLATYSHELRTPLTVVQGVTSTLLDRMDSLPSPVVRELLESLMRNARQMASLLDMFSDARRVGEHDLHLILEDVDLSELIAQTVADLSEVTKAHAVEVRAAGPVWASVDPVRIRQALANLLSNAAKFSPEGAPIELTIARRDATAFVAVIDHGRGIPPSLQGRLFRRFERLGATGKGLGLGLYLSRGIAHAHGGWLELARSDSRGTTFVLALPATVGATPPHPDMSEGERG